MLKMTFVKRNLKYIATACATAVIGIAAVGVLGQETTVKDKNRAEYKHKDKGFCGDNNWSDGDRVSVKEVREMTLVSTGSINVDGGQNGGISVKGSDRPDVLVRACVQAWASSEEAAKASAANIKINTSGKIQAENTGGDSNWSVSYQILVPRRTDLDLTAHNGGISIYGVDGTAEFETKNGGVNVVDVAGNFKGRTTNGGVNVSLTGASFKGAGLDVQTTNGGVNLTLPPNFAANIETGTVNGGFNSDIPELSITTENIKGGYRHQPKRIQTNINGGGALIKVITTNGGIRINTNDQ